MAIAICIDIPDLSWEFQFISIVAVVVQAQKFNRSEVIRRSQALDLCCPIGIIIAVQVSIPGLPGVFQRGIVITIQPGRQFA